MQESGGPLANLDGPYFDVGESPTQLKARPLLKLCQYIDAVLTLSEALIRRGRQVHSELNADVFNTLQSLASVVQVSRANPGSSDS